MRYSSTKLSNDKVITTACNFWRQIAWSFQVMSENTLFLGNKIFEIPPFFQTRPGDLGKKFTHAHYVFPPWRPGICWYLFCDTRSQMKLWRFSAADFLFTMHRFVYSFLAVFNEDFFIIGKFPFKDNRRCKYYVC